MSSISKLRFVLFMAVATRQAAAWGNLGHETVGYVAQQVRTSLLSPEGRTNVVRKFLAPKALSFVQSSLGSSYSESLGVAATVCL